MCFSMVSMYFHMFFANDLLVFHCFPMISDEFPCIFMCFFTFVFDKLYCFSMFSDDFHGYSCVSQRFPCIFICFSDEFYFFNVFL